MDFALFNLVLFTDPKQCSRSSFIREWQSSKICNKATQLIENQIWIGFDVLLELFLLRLDYAFENLGTPFKDVMVILWVKPFLEKVWCVVLFINLLFSFLSSQGILYFELQDVVDAFFPIIHIRPNAVIIQELAQVNFTLFLTAIVNILTRLKDHIEQFVFL